VPEATVKVAEVKELVAEDIEDEEKGSEARFPGPRSGSF